MELIAILRMLSISVTLFWYICFVHDSFGWYALLLIRWLWYNLTCNPNVQCNSFTNVDIISEQQHQQQKTKYDKWYSSLGEGYREKRTKLTNFLGKVFFCFVCVILSVKLYLPSTWLTWRFSGTYWLVWKCNYRVHELRERWKSVAATNSSNCRNNEGRKIFYIGEQSNWISICGWKYKHT